MIDRYRIRGADDLSEHNHDYPDNYWVSKTDGPIESSRRIRKFLMYVPESYDPARPALLVIHI